MASHRLPHSEIDERTKAAYFDELCKVHKRAKELSDKVEEMRRNEFRYSREEIYLACGKADDAKEHAEFMRGALFFPKYGE